MFVFMVSCEDNPTSPYYESLYGDWMLNVGTTQNIYAGSDYCYFNGFSTKGYWLGKTFYSNDILLSKKDSIFITNRYELTLVAFDSISILYHYRYTINGILDSSKSMTNNITGKRI